MTPKEVMDLIKGKNIEIVDLKFQDFPGTWQHFSIPISEVTPDIFDEGLGFDGSSIRGWQAIHASDMMVVPEPVTAIVDPFTERPTLSMICNIVDPVTRERYSRDPRYVADKAESYLKSTGIGDVAYFGPEAEFFILDSVRFDQNAHCGFYYVESEEGIWESGSDRGPNLGHKIRHKEGYFPVAPTDSQQDIRTEMILEMEKAGIQVEKHHHEVATAGQAEIDMRYDSLTRMADKMMLYKYISKNVALRYGKTVTFMPKPIFGDNGSGMHTHQSIWKAGQPLFAGNKYAGISDTCLYYIGGILKHASALVRVRRPHHQLLQAPGAGIRGARQPGLFLAQSIGRRPHSALFAEPQGQAHRGAVPRSVLQSLSGLRGHADGGVGRDPEQDRSGRAARQEPLRSAPRGAREGAELSGLARGVPGCPGEGP